MRQVKGKKTRKRSSKGPTSAKLAERAFAAISKPNPPTTVSDLAAQLGVPADRAFAGTLDGNKFKSMGAYRFVPRVQKGKKFPVLPEAPVYRASELDRPEVLGHVLQFILSQIQTRKCQAFSAADLGKKIRGLAGTKVRKALESALGADRLPPGLGAIQRNTMVFFRLEDLITGRGVGGQVGPETTSDRKDTGRSSTRVSISDFRKHFDAAFDDLDQAGRNLNFVKLSALRTALPEFEREAFDAGLRALRIEGRYDLNSAEGTHGQLTREEREAGIVEAGTRLVYCQRIVP